MKIQPAFSAVARDYDATFTDTSVGRLQRARVWDHLAAQVSSTPSVLELNCGTGADAIWMANRGWQVLATDISPQMVQVAQEKILTAGLSHKASARVCAFADLDQLDAGPFDLIFSNFGGFNCIPPEAVTQLVDVLHQKLKPGGQIIAVVMGRFCWWETLYFLLKCKPSQAFRRFQRSAVDARLDADTTVKTWYYSPADWRERFSNPEYPAAGKIAVSPIGFWLPPSYLDPFFAKRQHLLRFLNFLEKKCAPSWLALASDHFFIRYRDLTR